MKLLLDTRAHLWFLAGSDRLSKQARQAIEDVGNDRLFSIAGAWGDGDQADAREAEPGVPFHSLEPVCLPRRRRASFRWSSRIPSPSPGFRCTTATPFDRILVAQALVEGATLVSADPVPDAYGTARLW